MVVYDKAVLKGLVFLASLEILLAWQATKIVTWQNAESCIIFKAAALVNISENICTKLETS